MFSGTNSHYKKHKAETTTIFTKIKKAAGDADSAIISAINYYFPLVKYHDRWKKLSLSSFIDRNRNFYKFRNKGMAYSEKVSPYTAGNSYMEPSEGKSAALSGKNKAAFDEINEKCRDNGIRLVLITVPSANTRSDAKSQAVRELAKQSGLTYYDYNRSFPARLRLETTHYRRRQSSQRRRRCDGDPGLRSEAEKRPEASGKPAYGPAEKRMAAGLP